jgi:hypothetical protein
MAMLNVPALKKLKLLLPYDPAIPLLGYSQKKKIKAGGC